MMVPSWYRGILLWLYEVTANDGLK